MFGLAIMKDMEIKTTMTLQFLPTELATILKNILTVAYSEISTFLHCYKSLQWYDIFGKQWEKVLITLKSSLWLILI